MTSNRGNGSHNVSQPMIFEKEKKKNNNNNNNNNILIRVQNVRKCYQQTTVCVSLSPGPVLRHLQMKVFLLLQR